MRLKNSIGIAVSEAASAEQWERFSRIFVKLSILKGLQGVKIEEIFCFQNFTLRGWADVTFYDLKTCLRVAEAWQRQKDHQLLTGLCLHPLYVQDHLPLVVHMYSPHVPEGDIGTFLARHFQTVKGGTRILDEEGTWTGKRRYVVTLRPKPGCPGEFIHPPETFSIGPCRGFMWYPGQPRVCRRCGGPGHTKTACVAERCRFCGSGSHPSAQCGAPKSCSLCGSPDHLYRSCPRRSGSYAAALVAGDEPSVGGESGEP